jgi:hypothetical protein
MDGAADDVRDGSVSGDAAGRVDGGEPRADAGMCPHAEWPQAGVAPSCPVQNPTEMGRCGEPAAVFDGARCVRATGDSCDPEQRAYFGSVEQCAVACAARGQCNEQMFSYSGTPSGLEEFEVGDECDTLKVCSHQKPRCWSDGWVSSADNPCKGKGAVESVGEDLYERLCAFSLLPHTYEVECRLNLD